MLVYRLQDSYGHGPWSSNTISMAELAPLLDWYEDWVNEGIVQGYNTSHTNMSKVEGWTNFNRLVPFNSLRFAATSQKELIYWFGSAEFLNKLPGNWCVAIYFVPDQFVLIGAEQCCYDNRQAEMIACLSSHSMLNMEYDKFLDRSRF